MNQNTVFISYRRSLSKHLARSIYLDLRMNDWDVFLDVNTIDSGDFDRIILNQIGARAHFILLISKGSLKRCVNEGDWVLREIQEAVALDRNIVPIIEEDADFTTELAYLPLPLRQTIERKSGLPFLHFYFDAAMDMLRKRFLKTPEYVHIQETPVEEVDEVERRMDELKKATQPKPISLMALPKPFEWVDIYSSYFSMSKYPITNAQYAKFMKAGGYDNPNWWTSIGWQYRQKKGWTQPRFWNDPQWNGDDYPVVGVSWYEAVAFCLWLSDLTKTQITLPTE